MYNFDYEAFFGREMVRDMQYGLPSTKYMAKMQEYFDQKLLLPDNALLDEAHKTFILDRVLGLVEDASNAKQCLSRYVMNHGCRSVAEWQSSNRFIESFMELVIVWLPLHRSSILYAFYNEILFRRYNYYREVDRSVVEFVEAQHGARVDKALIDPQVKGELLLLVHIDVFRRKGGFSTVMETFGAPKPIGVKFLRHLIRFMWMIKPFYDEYINTEILPKIPEAAFKTQLLNFDTKNMREISLKDMDVIFDQMRLILQDTCDVEAVLLSHGFDFALKCLEADMLGKRILGLEWVTRQLTFYAERDLLNMRQQLRIKICESRYVDLTFNHSVMKKQLIDMAQPVFDFLVEDNAVTEKHIECVFRCIAENRDVDADVSAACCDLLASSVTKQKNYHVPWIWKNVQSLKADQLSKHAIRLVGTLARGLPATPENTDTRKAMEAWLWGVAENTKFRPECRAEAVTQIGQMPELLDVKVIKDKFLKERRLLYLRLLLGWVDSVPEQAGERRSAAGVMLHDCFTSVLRGIVDLRRELVKNPRHFDIEPPQTDVKDRLDILMRLARGGGVTLTQQMFAELWSVVLNVGGAEELTAPGYTLQQEEREHLLEALTKVANTSPATLSQLLSLVPAELVSRTGRGFAVFRDIFEGVNVPSKAIEFSGSTKPSMVHREQVAGLDLLWAVAAETTGGLAKEVQDYLLALYLGQPKDALRVAFCQDVLALLKPGTPEKATLRVLAILKTAIESTMKQEDREKRSASGIAGPAANEVALKEPPIPRYQDQRNNVERVLDSGMLPDFIPEDLRYVVVCLLYERFNWMRFDYWAGDLYENPELAFEMMEKARGYKRVLREDPNAKAKGDVRSCEAILSSDKACWETLFDLMEKSGAAVAQAGWEVMALLGTDDRLYKQIDSAEVDWNAAFGTKPSYRLLYTLQLLDRNFIPGRNEPAEDVTRKTDWCRRFLKTGGFRALVELLQQLAVTPDNYAAGGATQCLVSMLGVIYRFMRSPLPATEFSPDASAVLQLSQSSENFMFSRGSSVEIVPEVMFALVHAHATSEKTPNSADDQIGHYALYLMIAVLLKLPFVWSSLKDTPDFDKKLFAILTSKNRTFSAQVSERFSYLCKMFTTEPGPRSYFLNLLLNFATPDIKSRADVRHHVYPVFQLLILLLQQQDKPDRKLLKIPLESEIRSTEPHDAPEPDEYLAGVLELGTLFAKQFDATSVDEVITQLLSRNLYAPLSKEGTPTCAAKSQLLRKASFGLLTALLSANESSPRVVDAVVDAIGGRYVAAPLAADWKDMIVASGAAGAAAPVTSGGFVGDEESTTKTSRYMGLRNMACTCYMNATIQQLFNVPQFVTGILQTPSPAAAASGAGGGNGSGAANKPNADQAKQVDQLVHLGDILRRVLHDPSDELGRLLHSESDDCKLLANATYKDQPALKFLESIGWQNDGTGTYILPATVLLDPWQGHLKELNEKITALRADTARAANQVDAVQMFAQFQKLLAHLSRGGQSFYDPKLFVANFPNAEGNPVDPVRQEDAFEFFQRLQMILEEQLKGTNAAKLFEELFGVREVQVLRCETEKHAKDSHPQIAPVIPVGFAPDIMQALDQVYNQEGEWIVGTFKCDGCGGKPARGIKTMALESTSDYFVLYLKRYDADMRKITSPFTISEKLDLGKYSRDLKNPEDWRYTLTGVLVHDGISMNAGHYFSIIRKDDGWWKFNDTRVSPWKRPLTEDEIGAECVMLFYRREKLANTNLSIAMDSRLESDIWRDNAQLYERKMLCEKAAFGPLLAVMKRAVALVKADDEQRQAWLAQLAVRFVFETLARYADCPPDEWLSDVIAPLFKQSRASCRWFLDTLLNNADRASWLEEFLLRREEASVRRVFAETIMLAMDGVFEHEKHMFPTEPRAALAKVDPACLSVLLMDRICSLSEPSRVHWRKHHEFWDLIARWADRGALQRRHLAITEFPVYHVGDKVIAMDFPALVFDYFLGQFSPKCPERVVRSSIGDRASLNLQRQFDALALVMRSMSNPARKPSPFSLDLVSDTDVSVVDGKAPPMPSAYVQDLLLHNKVPDFMVEWIRLGYNSAANIEVMKHWSWESADASRSFLKSSVLATRKALADRMRITLCRYPIGMIVEALALKDTLADSRVARICEGTTETPSVWNVIMQNHSENHYSKDSAERMICAVAPLAKAVGTNALLKAHMHEKTKLFSTITNYVKEYISKPQDHDPAYIDDAKVIVQNLTL